VRRRLDLDTDKVHVIYPGISLDGFDPAPTPPKVATIGYLSRMCPDKGLDTLVDAFIELKHNERLRNARLRISGGMNPGDESFVEGLRRRLTETGCLDDVEFLGRFDRTARQAFLKTLSVLSVPEKQPVACGMYVIEALAAAVPVVEPAHGAFPELLQVTGGGLLYDPKDAHGLRGQLEKLLLDPDSADRLGKKAREAVLANFSAGRAGEQIVGLCEEVTEQLQRAEDG
jgi:glycosyltransferase involved in cell wall biosynthesis